MRARARHRRARVARAPARLTAIGVTIAAVGLLGLWGCQAGDPEAPSESWNLERMIQQRSYKAYEPTDLFPDGTVMRTPPAGTVPRERLLGPPELVDGMSGGISGGTSGNAPVTTIPIRLSMKVLANGRHHFDILCAACHGRAGDGHSPVAEAMTLRKPPSLHEARIRKLPDGSIYRVIRDGYGMMPSYATDLTVRERWEVVAYVRALQLSRRASVAELPPALRRELESAAPAAPTEAKR